MSIEKTDAIELRSLAQNSQRNSDGREHNPRLGMWDLVRWAKCAVLAGILAAGPAPMAWGQAQSGSQNSANSTVQAPTSNGGQEKADAPTANAGTTNFSLGLGEYDYSRAPKAFPTVFQPYSPIFVPKPDLSNSASLEQLTHDNKLELSLQQAIQLALENNLDIIVQRYNPWLAETDVLRSLAGTGLRAAGSTVSTINTTGSSTQGTSTPTTGSGTTNTTSVFSAGAAAGSGLGNTPGLSFDPILTGTISLNNQQFPVNNPFLAGTGIGTQSSVFALGSHTDVYNVAYNQGFWSGTNLQVAFDNTRASSNSPANLFNPYLQPTLSFAVQQQLLNGFGVLANTKNIRIAKNNKKIADLQFQLQVMTTVTSTITAYWELVYARRSVEVEEQAVKVSSKLYENNKKQLEIGTMAPLDVTTAESGLATDQQNLLLAQTTKLQQEQILKAAIFKDPLDPRFMNVEIIPTDSPSEPQNVETPAFDEGIKSALANRPDLKQQEINLNTQGINVKVTRNALLPTATLSASYGTTGLTGAIPSGENTSVASGGLGTAWDQLFTNKYPNYTVALNLQVPLRNRAAQADSEQAILQERQAQAQMQQLKNAVLLDVRNTFIAVQQDRARVEAANKARELQRQTFDAEQKKYGLGASTVYLVIQTQEAFVTAQGAQLRALIDLAEAKANYDRAIGRILDLHGISIAQNGEFQRDTLIPGTVNGRVIGTDAP